MALGKFEEEEEEGDRVAAAGFSPILSRARDSSLFHYGEFSYVP